MKQIYTFLFLYRQRTPAQLLPKMKTSEPVCKWSRATRYFYREATDTTQPEKLLD